MKKKLQFLLSLVVLTLFAGTAKAQEDVTSQYVKNADLAADVTAANNGWTCSWRQDYQKATDGEHVNVVEFYAGWGALEKTEFAISQVLTLPAGDYRLAVNAFYRNGEPGDATNNGKAYIFAGEKKQNVLPLGSLGAYKTGGIGGSADLQRASNAFYKGDYSNAFDFSLEEDGNIEIGFKGNFDLMRSWVILGPVKLYKYTLDAYISDYNAKVEEAKKLYDSPMNAGVLAALKEAATVDVESATKSAEITAAIQALTAAIADAEKSVAIYAATKATLDKCTSALDKDGLAAFDIADILAAYENGTMEEDQTPAILEAFVVATKAQSSVGADFTGAIVNPSFETGNVDGWTNTGTQSLGAQGNDSFDNKKGNFYAERWHAAGNINFKQTITGLPAGKYKLSAYIYSEPEGTLLIANDGQTTVTANASGLYEVEGTVIGGELVIGVECNLTATTWLCVDDFKLTLVEPFMNIDGIIYATVGENLIKNGSFEDGFAGWTGANDFKTEIKDGFTLKTTGAKDGDNYLVGTTNSGSVDAKSLGTAWAIETGKTYLFSYYVKKEKADAKDYSFLKTALTNTPGAETQVLGTPNIDSDTEWCQFQKVFENTEYAYLQVQFRWLNGQFGFDDFALYEVEMLSSELDAAKAKANAAIDALTPVGEGLFYYAPEAIAAAKAAVEAAETVEAVEAVVLPTLTLPKEGQAYAIANTTAEGNLCVADGAVTVDTDAAAFFTAVEGGYAISNADGEYIFKTTSDSKDTWSLSTTADLAQAYVLNVNVVEGGYTLQGKNGLLGTDQTAAGSTVYANKGVANNGVWTIAETEYVAPYIITIAETENGTVTADVVKAKAGATVTLTVTPAEGYELDELTVTYVVEGEEGEETKAVEVAEDYTFTMPEADVTVSATFAEIVVEEPTFANTPLTQDMFKTWDGFDASAKVVGERPYWDAAELGTKVGAGATVYGSGNVTNTDYADISDADVLRIEGTPGTQLRVMFNRQADNSLTELNPTIGEDGYVDVDLTSYEYVHLNAIKLGWGSEDGVITALILNPVAEEEPTYSIEIAATENGTVTADVEEAKAGETVTLTVTPAEGYELETLAVTYGEENTEVEVAEDYTFTMPEANVTVAATFAAIAVEEPNPTFEAELAHTASASWGNNAGKDNTLDSEKEYYNTETGTGWAGAAFAEFNMANLPKNAQVLNAQLIWAALNGNNNADRENKVYYLDAGQTLDYEDILANNDNAYLFTGVKTFITNIVGRGTYEEETDVTDAVKAILESGQSNIIFQWTGNAGGAELYGKASESAPRLVIEYLPGAPELANPRFDANPDDVVTVTTQGYQGNVKDDQVAGLQPVEAWTRNHETPKAGTSGDGYTGGVFAYGSTNLLNNQVAAPAAGPEGNSDGVALGLLGVWTGTVQYTQEVTLPAGDYILTYPVYNGVNTGAVTKNLFGFIAADGTEYLSDQKTFTVGEWQDVVVAFSVEETTTGNVSIGYIGGNHGSGSAPHLFVDNVSLVKVPGVELALVDLEKAIAAAKAEAGKYNVGEGLFQYSEAEMAPLADAIAEAQAAYDAAESKEAVEAATEALNAAVAAFAPAFNAPAEDQAYALSLTTANGTYYLNTTANEAGVTIEEEATPIYFVAQEDGKYAFATVDGEYVNYSGTNTWDIVVSSDAYGWTIAALADGGYSITGKNGLLGTGDSKGANGDTPGVFCYGDKKTSNGNYIWNITETEAQAPKSYTIEIAETANGTVTADAEEAEAGTTITLTVAPAEGYELDELTVTYGEDNTPVEVAAAEEEGVYTFAMPKGNVTVAATFIDIPVLANVADIAGIYDGNAEKETSHPAAGVMGKGDEDMLVTISVPETDEVGKANVTFSDFTILPQGTQTGDVTIANVEVLVNEAGVYTLSAEGVPVSIVNGMMTTNYTASVTGTVDAEGNADIILTLQQALTVTVHFTGKFNEELTTGIDTVKSGDAVKANGKYLENGKVVIYRNGIKYGVNGAVVK